MGGPASSRALGYYCKPRGAIELHGVCLMVLVKTASGVSVDAFPASVSESLDVSWITVEEVIAGRADVPRVVFGRLEALQHQLTGLLRRALLESLILIKATDEE